LGEDFSRQQAPLNKTFWSAAKNQFAFALDRKSQQVDEPSVLATVPMWFGLLDEDKAGTMIAELAAPEHQADWGMRIISSGAPKYSAGGYHFGSVWPLFTGWASVGEYRYHRALPGFSNLMANAQLALDGSSICFEVLSGDYYQPLSTSSPHQIWSAAMVITAAARTFWFADRCQCATAYAGPACPGGLEPVHAGPCARGPVYFASGLPQERQRNVACRDAERQRRLQSGFFSRA
jgi:glycogen debranching enzyme